MRLLLDSFWRSVAYCMHPRVIVLSLLPLGLMVLMAALFGYFYWDATVAWTRDALDAWPLLASFWAWIGRLFSGDVTAVVAPMVVVIAATPLIVVVALLVVSGLMAPALTRLVAERRFPSLEQKKGASFLGSVFRSLGLTVLALLALVVSMPLWLIPPLVLILPPLIWGWLTYRVMSFDALSEHANPEERATLLRAHRLPLLGIGVLCGYLGAAHSGSRTTAWMRWPSCGRSARRRPFPPRRPRLRMPAPSQPNGVLHEPHGRSEGEYRSA
jgi:hypothetical protein